jgi:hypothetical protein
MAHLDHFPLFFGQNKTQKEQTVNNLEFQVWYVFTVNVECKGRDAPNPPWAIGDWLSLWH